MLKFPIVRGMPAVLLLAILTGCIRYAPAPILPAQVQADFMTRSLSDPGLRTYVEANLSAKPAAWPLGSQDLFTLTLAAFYYRPEFDVAQAQLEAARAAITTAGARPNPVVSAGRGYSTLAQSPYLIRFLLDQSIETAGKRGLRILRARQLAEVARIELAESAWQARARLRAALLEHMIATRSLDRLALEEERLRIELAALMDRRFAVGEVSRPDVENAHLLLDAAKGAALAAAVGVPVAALESIALVWTDLDSPPSEGAIPPAELQRAGLLNRPDVRRSLAEYAVSEAHLQIEVARQYPDLRLGPGYSFDDAVNKFTFVPSLAVPILNRNQGPIAEAEARRKEAAARFTAVQAGAIHRMEQALAGYGSARQELAAAEDAVMTWQKREQAALRELKIGEADRVALAEMRLQGVMVATVRLRALQKAQEAFGELEDAVQRPLPPDLPLPPLPAAGSRGKAAAGRQE